ncbi:MAG: TonB-dependent receptor family protein [Sphingobium sp.]
MSIRFLLSAGCALATFSTYPAHADEEPDSGAEGRTIIVTGYRQADEAKAAADSTPGGTDIVTYQDYADRSVMSLRDTLAFSPGVYLQPRYGQEIRISIRGSGLSRGYHMRGLTLLQDGVPINLADDNGDFQEMEPTFFDHLEVYRGANALRFGSGTLGGAINGITPRGSDASGLYLRADGGSFQTMRGLASFGGASGVADYWMGASADRSDGDREHAKRHSFRFHGNVGLKLGEGMETRFYASVNAINQQLPGALTRADVLTNPEKGNFAGDQQRDIDSIRMQNRTSIDLGDGTLTAGLFLNDKALFHPIFQVIDQQSTDVGAFTRFDYQAGPFALTLGGEVRRGSMRARQYLNVNGKRGALTFDADQDARTANLYGELRVRPTARLSLIAGAIYADGWRARHVRFSNGQDGRKSFDEFSPRFGLLYNPADHVQFYANYSRSAEFPGFGEVFQSVGMPPVSSFISAIHPQTAWTAEIGTRGSIGLATWDVTLYRADLKGEMLQYSVSSSIPAATFNADRTRHQGIEASLSLDLADWLRLRQVYQYSDFRFRDDAQFGDNRLPVVPRHMYRAELRIGTDGLHVSPNVEWVSKGAWADYSNTTRTKGYALLGLSAGASIGGGMDIFIDARNLTQKTAIGDISATLTAGAASAIYYPVERRAVFGGARVRF